MVSRNTFLPVMTIFGPTPSLCISVDILHSLSIISVIVLAEVETTELLKS